MPVSTGIFKQEAIEFIKTKFNSDHNVLDIGAGCGTYSQLLKSHLPRMDAIEIFEPYVEAYNLKEQYNNLYVKDAVDFQFEFYNLIIVGDVLEHIDESRGIEFIKRIYNKCDDLVVSVPFHAPQGEHYGNIYETHLQAELSHAAFMEKYDGFRPLCVRYDFGVYIKDDKINANLPIILEEETLGTIFPELQYTFKLDLQRCFPSTKIVTYKGTDSLECVDIIRESMMTVDY